MRKEVELKFLLKDKEQLFIRLRELNIKVSKSKKQKDTIYMYKGRSFDDLEKGEPIIRIRTTDDDITTTVKRYINGIIERQEVECVLQDDKLFGDYLKVLNYEPIVKVEKQRCEYKYRDANIAVDDVIQLGSFVEVEIILEDDDSEQAIMQIKQIAKELGIDINYIVNKPYDQMIYEKERGLYD